MPNRTVIFTALPAGVLADGSLLVAVFISPRLGGPEQTLAPYADWRHWAGTDTTFTLEVGGVEVETQPWADALHRREDLWDTLFRDTTPVTPYQFQDLRGSRIRSYPGPESYDFIRNLYTHLAIFEGAAIPSRTGLSTRLAGITFPSPAARNARVRQLEHQIRDRGGNHTYDPAQRDPRTAALEADLFMDRPTTARNPLPPFQMDFHTAVASMGDYTQVLRLLGLIREVVIPRRGTEVFGGSHGIAPLRVLRATWAGVAGTRLTRPYTQALFDDAKQAFRAASLAEVNQQPGGRLLEGHLALGDGSYRLVEVDVDGGIMHLNRLTGTLQQLDAAQTAYTKKDHPAPALRSGGLTLMRSNRASEVAADIARAAQLEADRAAGKDLFLTAEDLTRGYAVDVFDSVSLTWHSLCARIGTFRFGTGSGATTFGPDHLTVDEAPVTLVGAGAGGGVEDIYVHEALARWTGWSLAAPRPGKVIPESDASDAVVDDRNDPLPDFPLTASFAAGFQSLPRLRFGRTYTIRARAVDLAGNRVPLARGRNDSAVIAPSVTYGRFEPLPPPAIAFRNLQRTVGESPEVLVLRSNFNAPADYASRPQRLVVPPKASWELLEHHGQFDAAGRLRADAYLRFAELEDGTLRDPNVPVDPTHPAKDPVIADNQGDPYTMTYLADPLARSVRISGIAGGDQIIDLYPPGHAWPNPDPIALVLGAGVEGAHFDDGGPGRRTLTITLPKAAMRTFRYSSVLDRPRAQELGLWQWTNPQPGTGLIRELTDGTHWMVSPSRELVLVHAVRQPLHAPVVQVDPNRDAGQTSASLQVTATVYPTNSPDPPSTDAFHLDARWSEQDDTQPGGPVTNLGRRALIARVPIPLDWPTGPTPLQMRQEFGDTKHRLISYVPTANSRFRDYFPLHVETVTFGRAVAALALADLEEGTEVVTTPDAGTPPDPRAVYQQGQDYTVDVVDGILIRAADGAIPPGGTVKVSYRQSTIRTGHAPTVHIVSSARPAAPLVKYVVPTFGWDPEPGNGPTGPMLVGEERTSTRSGRGFRVYLDRPWYSSGDDEMLGVVAWPADRRPTTADAGLVERARALVTQVGADPVWAPRVTPEFVTADQIVVPPEQVDIGVWLAELPADGPRFSVAYMPVAFDSGRQLWYADIEMRPAAFGGSYTPFVRLALVRYQKFSVAKLNASPVVLTDFTPVTEDRTLKVTRADDTTLRVTLQGTTYRNRSAGVVTATAVLEGRNPGIDDEELGWMPLDDVDLDFALSSGNLGTWTGNIRLPRSSTAAARPSPTETFTPSTSTSTPSSSTSTPSSSTSTSASPSTSTTSTTIATPPGGRMRLVVREFEAYMPVAERSDTLTTRAVYIDVIEVA